MMQTTLRIEQRRGLLVGKRLLNQRQLNGCF
jgi:hypothetical protein